jgi:hypothetical protein
VNDAGGQPRLLTDGPRHGGETQEGATSCASLLGSTPREPCAASIHALSASRSASSAAAVR